VAAGVRWPSRSNEPLGVVAGDELPDDPMRLGETLEAMQIEALLLSVRMNRSMTPLHSGSPTYDGARPTIIGES